MAQQGATLQNYNNELVKCIEDLREKREEVNRAILKEEEEKAKIQKVRPVVSLDCPSTSELMSILSLGSHDFNRSFE